MAYTDKQYYTEVYGGTVVPDNELQRLLETASMQIDSLTFNRIVGRGFSNLTPFQQEVVKKVVCMQTDFLYENDEAINSALSGYSINGVNAQFGSSWNVFTDKGIAMRRDVYTLLQQTGLCYRGVG